MTDQKLVALGRNFEIILEAIRNTYIRLFPSLILLTKSIGKEPRYVQTSLVLFSISVVVL